MLKELKLYRIYSLTIVEAKQNLRRMLKHLEIKQYTSKTTYALEKVAKEMFSMYRYE